MQAAKNRQLGKAEILAEFDAVVAVADVNLSIRRSEIFCIMGLSGSGKSTVVRHINRLLDPTSGNVKVDGEDITLKSPEQLRKLRAEKIGMVFQNFGLLPHRTVRDNVGLPAEIQGVPKQERYRIAEEALELVGLIGWGDRRCNELSGGMQQRVGLARAIAADPIILLMDEPFSALDPLIRRSLQEQFKDLSKSMNKTTVFITHDLDEAMRIGDRIAIMKDGAIVQVGTPEDIVYHPADDYVGEFVAHVPKLGVMTARTVMKAYGDDQKNVDQMNTLPRVKTDCPLKDLISLCAEHTSDIIVSDNEGQALGYLNREILLTRLRESI